MEPIVSNSLTYSTLQEWRINSLPDGHNGGNGENQTLTNRVQTDCSIVKLHSHKIDPVLFKCEN